MMEIEELLKRLVAVTLMLQSCQSSSSTAAKVNWMSELKVPVAVSPKRSNRSSQSGAKD